MVLGPYMYLKWSLDDCRAACIYKGLTTLNGVMQTLYVGWIVRTQALVRTLYVGWIICRIGQYVWFVDCGSMTMYLSIGLNLDGFQLISLCRSVSAMFYQHYLGDGILFSPPSLVISTLTELENHHSLQIFLTIRNALASVFSDTRQLYGETHFHLFFPRYYQPLW